MSLIRSSDPEIMDDLDCQGPVVNQTLEEIDFINQVLGGNQVSLNGIDKLATGLPSCHVMDIGCGSGDLLKRMHKRLQGRGIEFEGTGIDANPYIIEHARAHCADIQNLKFESLNVMSPEYARLKCDIVHASLFLHHFSFDELVELFGVFKNQARVGMVISDLHRHWLAHASIKFLTRLFSKSEMVRYDAALSVKRGFLREEWKNLLVQSGIYDFELSWHWAFRWQLIIRF